MSRDYLKLRVFQMADQLALDVYRTTKSFPREERYGLQSQIRRAAVSIAANIVEGCARTTTRDYLHFLSISLGSANETRYLIDLALRLEMIKADAANAVTSKYSDLIASLTNLIRSLRDKS